MMLGACTPDRALCTPPAGVPPAAGGAKPQPVLQRHRQIRRVAGPGGSVQEGLWRNRDRHDGLVGACVHVAQGIHPPDTCSGADLFCSIVCVCASVPDADAPLQTIDQSGCVAAPFGSTDLDLICLARDVVAVGCSSW